MKRLLAMVALIISFSVGHLTFAQECTSSCSARQSWEVLDSGCSFTSHCYDATHLSCQPGYNHCCYYE
jgi:hypothetical protein